MEYNELIEQARQTHVDVPDTDAILGGMRRTVQRRRRQQLFTVAAVCLLFAVTPLILPSGNGISTPTLAETVSATLPSSTDDLPAPLAGYKNSIRNHQTTSII